MNHYEKKKTTAEKENTVDFLLAGLTFQSYLTQHTKGGELYRPKSERESGQQRQREREKENVINHNTDSGPYLVEVFQRSSFFVGLRGERPVEQTCTVWVVNQFTNFSCDIGILLSRNSQNPFLPSLTKPHDIKTQTSCHDLKHSPCCNIKKLTRFSLA